MRRDRCVSKTPPRASQTTQSSFMQELYTQTEAIEDLSSDMPFDEVESAVQDVISALNTLADQCEESRDNMPSQLQEAYVGEMLSNRAEAVRNFVSELEGVSIDEDDLEDSVSSLQSCSYGGE